MDVRGKRNIQQFNGERYSVWKYRIKSLLSELQVLDVIENEKPTEPDENWIKRNTVAKNTIIEFLGDSYLNFAQKETNAVNILRNMDDIYERQSLATQLTLRKQLLNFKLEVDVKLLDHFTKFEEIITELISAGANIEEMDKVSHLLLTLPSSYNGVITALETMSKDDLNLAFVKSRLLDHETKLRSETVTGFKVLQTDSQSSSSTFNKRYKNYNKQHFKKKSHYKKFSPKKFQYKYCEHCGRKNHIKRDCYYYKQMTGKHREQSRVIQQIETTNTNQESFAFMLQNMCRQSDSAKNHLTFLMDSGATDHIVNQLDVFTKYTELNPPIRIGIAKSGASVLATAKGCIEVTTNKGVQGSLMEVLYCPEVPHNLLSVRKIQQTGMTVIFTKSGVEVRKDDEIILSGEIINNLYKIIFGLNKLNYQINNVTIKHYKLWHARLGHISKSSFEYLRKHSLFDDNTHIQNIKPDNEICETCIFGKQVRLPFAKAKSKSPINKPLFIIHSDICGPITPPTLDDKHYFVTFIDDYTHYTVTYLMNYKSEVLKMFKDYVAKSETYLNSKIVNLYCDNGREYLSNDFKDFCVQKGIMYHLTVPHTPQQNGVSERMNRTLTEKARTLVISANLGKEYWGEAILTSTYLTNRLPTKALKINKTPYELWHNKKPKINNLKIFGSTVYVHNKTRKSKFDEKSFKAILVGYEPNGYKLWDVEHKRFFIARDVIVDETNFKNSRPLEKSDQKSEVPNKVNKSDIESDKLTINEHQNNLNDELKNFKVNKSDTKSDKLTNNEHQNTLNDELTISDKKVNIRRSERIKHLPLTCYDENKYNNFDKSFMISNNTLQSIPKSYYEIFERNDKNKWEEAIKDEINSLLTNKTWILVNKPENKNIISCKWVFNIKNNERGEPSKYKARLVARGFSQQYLEDYDETFAPVTRITTLRFMLAFSNQYDLLIHHMDVKTAFLNGILKEEIYMEVPDGIKADRDQVCRLNKSLYGLKQSSRCWFERFDNIITQKGFKNSKVDPCLYILDKGHIMKNIYIVLYVDDLLIATKDINTLTNFKSHLMQSFKMTDLQEIKFFLGIQIKRTKDKLTLDQSTYLKNVLNKFSMSDCVPIKSPLPSKLNYKALNSEVYYNAPSRNLIGCLMYAMLCTRPDISAAVNILSRYQSKNNKELWNSLKNLLRYIKGTVDLKLTYRKTNFKSLIIGYADSDWGNNEIDRKSTSGYLFKVFDNCTISWNTRKQSTVAASSTEAEYMALFEAVKEAVWLKGLITSINIKIKEPIIIFEDNNGCISIANNPTDHKRSKHIDIKYHFTREKVESKVIIIKYIPTGQQLADVFTKVLPSVKFSEVRLKLGLE